MTAVKIWEGVWRQTGCTYRVVLQRDLKGDDLIVERSQGTDAMGERSWRVICMPDSDYTVIVALALASNPVDATAAIEAVKAKVDGLALP